MLYESEKPEVHLDTVDKVGTIHCFVLLDLPGAQGKQLFDPFHVYSWVTGSDM